MPTRRLLLRWKVFAFGFGLSLPLLILEYLTEGGFPGWIILVPTNPTTLAAALVAHGVEPLLGPRWSNEAFFGTFILESAVWWYLVAGLVDLARRRRKTRVSVTSASSATDAEARNLTKPQPAHSPPESARRDERAK